MATESQQRELMPHEIHAEAPQPTGGPDQQRAAPASWADSLFDLISSRIALIQFEAKQAAAKNAGRAVMFAAAALAAAVSWLLIMAAITGMIHALTGFAWYWTCLILAVIHLLAMAVLFRAARAPGPPAFEHTLAEFQKDRAWLQSLQNPKSKP